MTVESAQNTKILQKLDELSEDVNGIKQDIAGIKQQIEYQPRIDLEAHKAIDHRFKYDDDRIKKLEESQTWAVRLIIATILTSLISLVLSIYR